MRTTPLVLIAGVVPFLTTGCAYGRAGASYAASLSAQSHEAERERPNDEAEQQVQESASQPAAIPAPAAAPAPVDNRPAITVPKACAPELAKYEALPDSSGYLESQQKRQAADAVMACQAREDAKGGTHKRGVHLVGRGH